MAVQISGNDITVPRDGSFTRNVTIGGTLTYEDVTNIDSVGLVTARNGIEIGTRPGIAASISVDGNMIVSGISTFGGDIQVPDKIIHAGDTNTALRFPAADTITAETGGTERARIDSSGRLLLGTATASSAGNSQYSKLEVSGNTSGATGPGHLSIKRGTATASMSNGDTIGRLIFSSLDGGDFAYIQVSADAAPGSSDYPGRMMFFTAADGASSATERLRIGSDGKIFVANEAGTIDTTTRLGEGNRLQLSGLSSNDGISVVRYSTGYGAWGLNLGRSRSGTLGTNTILADNDDIGHITFWGADGSDFNKAAQISAEVDGTPSDGTDMPGALVFKTSAEASGTPTERLRIDSSGKLGVGNNNPSFLLDLKATSSADVLRLGNTAESSHGNADVKIVAGGSYYQNFDFQASTYKFQTYNGSSVGERMRITSTGTVLHGSGAVATQKATNGGLDVACNGLSIIFGADSNSGNPSQARTNNTAKDQRIASVHYTNAEEPIGIVRAYSDSSTNQLFFGGGSSILNAATQISFYTASNNTTSNGTERLRIKSDGKLLINNTGAVDPSQLAVKGVYPVTPIEVQQDTANNHYAITFRNSNGLIGNIITQGSGTTYNTSSDYRLKENATTISDGITRLKSLKPYRFNFKVDTDTTVDGFFAHEVTPVVPEAITGIKDEVVTQAMIDEGKYNEGTLNNPIYQGIDQSKLVPLLTAALQEAVTEIESLKSRLDAAGL